MNTLKFVLSLTTKENDYQREQAAAAEDASRRVAANLQIIYADNDAINQSQQLLKIIQAPESTRPNAIIFEPVGTGLPQVARAAASAGIGWVVLNRDVDYISELRRGRRAPMFAVSSDHDEVGRIQGRQIEAMVPNGGYVLYIQGPASSSAALQRTSGMSQTKPSNVQVRMLKGQWTEESAENAVASWLRLSTSREVPIDIVVAQDDAMAIGARRALVEQANPADRDRWSRVPFTGCDGMPETGLAWVKSGLLAATVHVPANAGTAIEMLAEAIATGVQPPERSLTVPKSYPTIEALASKYRYAGAAR
ncbi:MAG TPA: substrate-binding domain-containing protein [Terriglobales bacterium]|nr:substrate-binding domain-containing protein [Terriglobales bacterium]